MWANIGPALVGGISWLAVNNGLSTATGLKIGLLSMVPLYLAGAKMLNYFPVSIPYHGNALNITVQSYAGFLDFGLISCRRVLPQSELHSLAKHLRRAFAELGGVQAASQSTPHPVYTVPTAAATDAKPKAARSGKSGGGRRSSAEARSTRRHPTDTSAQRDN